MNKDVVVVPTSNIIGELFALFLDIRISSTAKSLRRKNSMSRICGYHVHTNTKQEKGKRKKGKRKQKNQRRDRDREMTMRFHAPRGQRPEPSIQTLDLTCLIECIFPKQQTIRSESDTRAKTKTLSIAGNDSKGTVLVQTDAIEYTNRYRPIAFILFYPMCFRSFFFLSRRQGRG